jgi:hypothetical protein
VRAFAGSGESPARGSRAYGIAGGLAIVGLTVSALVLLTAGVDVVLVQVVRPLFVEQFGETSRLMDDRVLGKAAVEVGAVVDVPFGERAHLRR